MVCKRFFARGTGGHRQGPRSDMRRMCCGNYTSTAFAEDVKIIDPFDVPLSRSWKTLRAQIKAEQKATTPKVGVWSRFGGLQGGLIGVATAACIAVLLVSVQPTGDDFATLTSEDADATHIIKFQLADNVDAQTLDRLLAEFGAILIAGPTNVGIYTASVPDDRDMQAVANAMMATSEILFAAPEVEQ